MQLLELIEKRVIMADGGTGTERMRLAAPAGVPGDLLNLQAPDLTHPSNRRCEIGRTFHGPILLKKEAWL